jgi:rfaE bifunctional protein kinase chain/domain
MTTAEILAQFAKLRVLVAGDVCLDRWCRYDPALADPSRETGIPRIGVVATQTTPGGGGTVANNVAALGARVGVLGLAGTDGFGYELEKALARRGIAHDLLLRTDLVPTFTYTKLINLSNDEEDLPRVDFVYTRPLPEELDAELARRLGSAAGGYDVLLVSDQAETESGGVVTARMREALARVAAANPEMVIWVDSRMRGELFRNVIVKLNRREADAASMRATGGTDYGALRRHTRAPLVVITHGGEGAVVVDERGTEWVRTTPQPHPVDICGAGDSFSAGAALALRVTGGAKTAARFGNLVASITIMKKGTGTASPEEVLAAEA